MRSRDDDPTLDPLISGGFARDLFALALGEDEEAATVVRESDSAESQAGVSSRFTPGALVANRFRIVALAGRGGMGEVYRAEDTELGQAVALKFIPEAREMDRAMVDRYRAEVRLGRRIAHPNVCRIYDLIDIEGRPAIVMEYVEGEDLKSLLSRVGRLPYTRALEIAREVCAGVEAAHERRIVHGDLKPANVMIDGEGRVRISDFGLARVAGTQGEGGQIAGTIAYMAPEQAARGVISEAADVFSLGLIIYEIFTGERAREVHTIEEAAAAAGADTPPSELQPRIDGPIESAILLALSRDPGVRPSARALRSAFPSRDPLEAMIAAGRTPSPDLVAATELGGALDRRGVAALGAFAVIALFVLLAISETLTMYGRSSMPHTTAVLSRQARALAESISYVAPTADEAAWFEPNTPFLHDRFAKGDRGGPLADAPLPPIVFHYRASPAVLVPVRADGRIGTDAPPLHHRGEVRVTLSPMGTLLALSAVPPQDARSFAPAARWKEAVAATPLARAGEEFRPGAWLPPVPFDERAVWRSGDLLLRAAALGGRLTHLEVVPASALQRPPPPLRSVVPRAAYFLLLTLTTAAGVFLARRNARARRIDTLAALRIAFWVFATRLVHMVITSDHPLTLDGQPQFATMILGSSLLLAAEVWLGYAALEPYIRRRWPRIMVAWTRLAHGRWKDPFVGRAILVGVSIGLMVRLADHLRNALTLVVPVTVVPSELAVEAITSVWRTVGGAFLYQSHAIFFAVFAAFLLVLLQIPLRSRRLAVVAWVAATVIIWNRWDDARIDVPILVLQMSLYVLAIYRAGLLGMAVALYVQLLTVHTPLTNDPAAIYFAQSVVATGSILLIVAIGVYLAIPRARSEARV